MANLFILKLFDLLLSVIIFLGHKYIAILAYKIELNLLNNFGSHKDV